MSALITYSHIDNNKNTKISTHPIDSLDEFLKFVLANKEYMNWANLTDIINGNVIEQYINIKNYQNSGLDNTQLCLKGNNLDIYKKVDIIHKIEFQSLVEFIKETNELSYKRLIETKAFKMLPLKSFFQSKISEQFYILPCEIYDVIMGEFTTNLDLSELLDFQEKFPIAKEVRIDISEKEEA